MKNIFVVTDNRFIYNNFKLIIDTKKELSVNYYCSPKSKKSFSDEIKNELITPKHLKNNSNYFIDKYEMGISCHSKQIFPNLLVNTLNCINIHPGLNPFNRGWYPQVFSMINGLPAGATIHVMDEEIDHGDIIIQAGVDIKATDTSLTLYNRIQAIEIELLKNNIDNIFSGKFLTKAPINEGNYNSIKDYKNICEIDLDKKVTMKEAINYLRAMTHPPYKNSYFIDGNGKKIFLSIELEEEQSRNI